ncbi:hypothetical protein [Caballeronia catudaia]|uniref:hypothetical protein n=1 Tax=Caballeronia catudaia TaxID=1777136 RepID=UPI00117F5BF5|nr:hypothetical protein [Caballeronia catudaia]
MFLQALKVILLCVALLTQDVFAKPVDRCGHQLQELIVPSLRHAVFERQKIMTALDDLDGSFYNVRLYVASNNPDNLDGEVTIGWVKIDIRSFLVFDVTRDPDHPERLKTSRSAVSRYVARCIDAPAHNTK